MVYERNEIGDDASEYQFLITKIDLSNVTKKQKPLLFLNMFLDNMTPTIDFGSIYIATTKKATKWTPVAPLLTTTSDKYVDNEYDISDYAGKSEVYVAFRYNKEKSNVSSWAIDEYGV